MLSYGVVPSIYPPFIYFYFRPIWTHQITMYDDFEPYSFFFREQTPYGAGICGGVILHGRENLEKAYYGIHT